MSEATISAASEESLEGAQSSGPPEPQKRRLDPGFKRNIKMIGVGLGALILIAVLFIVFSSKKAPDAAIPSSVSLGTSGTQKRGEVTPAMADMLREKQLEEASAAAAKNKSYIPPDSVGAIQPVQPGYGPGVSTFSQGSAPVYQQGNSERDNRMREGMTRQLSALLGEPSAGNDFRQRVEVKQQQQQNTAGAVAKGAVPQSGISTPVSTEPLIAGLEIASGELASDLKVPAGAQVYASAKINSGPAAGAFLVGAARVVDEGLEISFTQMRFKNKIYAISAIVLDETTASNAIAGSVDRKMLQRYVLPVFFAGVQGFFAAKSQVGSSLVSIGTGNGISTPPPTAEQARAAGVAEALKIGQKEVDSGANKQIVVSSSMRTPVGILFRAPVLE